MSGSRLLKGLFLAIEPTNPPGSIAIGRERKVLSYREISPGRQFSENFLPLFSEMIQQLKIVRSDVEGIVICAGPGSFTGIRVGFSFAYGIAHALGVPIYPVPTLDTMAFSSPEEYDLVVPTMDARKGEVYAAEYRREGGKIRRESEYVSIRPENLIYKVLPRNPFLFGQGYLRYRKVFNGNGIGPYPGEEEYPGLLNAGTLLEYFFSREDIPGVDPENAHPIYVRPSEAELKFSRRET